MRSGFTLGRIFGIEIRIDWSWLFIVFLVTWNLAAAFGQAHRNWGPAATWGTAVLAALLFFASVLAHELAHSLVARAQGVPVRDITLFLFGGVSNIQRHPASPGAEFAITVVGPATSFVMGLLFILIAVLRVGPVRVAATDLTSTMGKLDALSTLLLWVGPVNLLLAGFNLIPGFPLDGGRILRSVLWALTGNLKRATRWAAAAGQMVAWLMIVGGISMVFGARLPFFGTGLVNGLWLAFIGWFLNSASSQSYQQVLLQDVLEGRTVAQMMRRDPPTVEPGITVTELIHDFIMARDDHAFPVVEAGRLVGLVTLEDVRRVPREARDSTQVRAVMTTAGNLVTVPPEAEASEGLSRLQERDVRQLPVVRGGQLVGLLRRRDIIKWLQMEAGRGMS